MTPSITLMLLICILALFSMSAVYDFINKCMDIHMASNELLQVGPT